MGVSEIVIHKTKEIKGIGKCKDLEDRASCRESHLLGLLRGGGGGERLKGEKVMKK